MNFNVLKDFLYIINFKVYIIIILSVIATYICTIISLVGNMPTALIGIAVVFPIVFSINSAFQRRDKALEHYGIINANLTSIYFAHLNWPKKNQPLKENPNIIKIIKELFSFIKQDLITSSSNNTNKKEIYDSFLKISNKNEKLRNAGVSDGEISRINNWLNNSIVSYEKISSISDYRTPRGLKAYSQIFLHIFPILFAPYFASLNEVISYLGYIVAILYSSVLVMLSNIQNNIENPFDNVGLDDINLDKENRFKNLFWSFVIN